jgi:hypothetical protein
VSEKFRALVNKLAFPHHASGAYRALLNCGLRALPAVQTGLQHKSADVRYRCCQFLDHYLMPEIIDDLVVMLDDPDHRVRCAALHAVACDRCKEGSCRPEEATVLPRAIGLLADDPNPHVRAMAVEVVARWVHSNPEAEAALLRARGSDSSPTVRKKAGWYVPGGPIHGRTVPSVRGKAGNRPQSEVDAAFERRDLPEPRFRTEPAIPLHLSTR